MSGHEDVRRALACDFPGWTIEVYVDETEVDWGATRPLTPGHGGIIGLTSDNPVLLRELLEEAKRCDERLALRDLAIGLNERGIDDVTVRGYDTNVIVEGPGERERLVTCQGGAFWWAMGGDQIGPIDDVSAAVKHVIGVLKASSS